MEAIRQHKRMAMGESIEGAPTFGCEQVKGGKQVSSVPPRESSESPAEAQREAEED